VAPERVNLVVLFGGRSAEHDVSRVTAAHVLQAVDRDRYTVKAVGITREGEWLLAEDAVAALAAGETLKELEVAGRPTSAQPALSAGAAGSQTVVLPLLHGPLGEDGTVQGMLELADVPYVGAGVLSSALCMDKAMAKQVLAYHGIAQPAWLSFREHEVVPTTATHVADRLGLPVFVKPANLGSSVGISKAKTVAEVDRALRVALEYDEWVVVEEAVRGREIEVAVLGNEAPRASVPEATAAEVRELAVTVFRAVRAEGMARVDFFYEEGGRGFLCNEVNTIPGFTPISMYPKLWEATGVPYSALIDELVRLALERHSHRRHNTSR
jgi:D-alanine-D-alanine ligase